MLLRERERKHNKPTQKESKLIKIHTTQAETKLIEHP